MTVSTQCSTVAVACCMLLLLCFCGSLQEVSGFLARPQFSSTISHAYSAKNLPTCRKAAPFVAAKGNDGADDSDDAQDVRETSAVVKTVAVAGATGRTGSLVVSELLARGVNVVALVRNTAKAEETLPSSDPKLSIVQCDHGNSEEIKQSVKGADADAAIWCATGFSDGPSSILDRVKNLLGIALAPKKSIDAVGVVALAEAFAADSINGENGVNGVNGASELPKVIMLSSAGVTRPSWDENKKERLIGCSDIPIVRLNPFGILDTKRESEEKLRQTGTPYCIFRPGGLNDNWPIGGRPVFSQGDVAVGRINRADVAKILVDCLAAPEAVRKTWEGITLQGYQPAKSIGPALDRLQPDSEGVSEEVVQTTYNIMQQLLPGETQQPEKLAMGQTYEQLDKGETGRLGERGKEDAVAAAPKPSSK